MKQESKPSVQHPLDRDSKKNCQKCEGTGRLKMWNKPCNKCQGTGERGAK